MCKVRSEGPRDRSQESLGGRLQTRSDRRHSLPRRRRFDVRVFGCGSDDQIKIQRGAERSLWTEVEMGRDETSGIKAASHNRRVTVLQASVSAERRSRRRDAPAGFGCWANYDHGV